jgi:hypothetical protein
MGKRRAWQKKKDDNRDKRTQNAKKHSYGKSSEWRNEKGC